MRLGGKKVNEQTRKEMNKKCSEYADKIDKNIKDNDMYKANENHFYLQEWEQYYNFKSLGMEYKIRKFEEVWEEEIKKRFGEVTK